MTRGFPQSVIESEKKERMHPVKEAFLSIMAFVGFGVLVAYAVTGGIFFTQTNNNSGEISTLQTQLAATQAALNATNAIVANLTANSGGGGGGGDGGSVTPVSTLIETGTFQWYFGVDGGPPPNLATQPGTQYNWTLTTLGTFRYYTLTLTPPANPYTVPSCGFVFAAVAGGFSPGSRLVVGFGSYVTIPPEDAANIVLTCYQTGTCTLGSANPGNNGLYTAGDGPDSLISYRFYAPSCTGLTGTAFSMTGPMHVIIPSA